MGSRPTSKDCSGPLPSMVPAENTEMLCRVKSTLVSLFHTAPLWSAVRSQLWVALLQL